MELQSDWRDFRARLVEQEMRENSSGSEPEELKGKPGADEEGWAYATPLIEQGSLLLSAPGGHFALSQQYFHKTVIFIVEHTSTFTRGVILNRPTAFSTADLEGVVGSDIPAVLLNGTQKWNVWCGGDCQGLSSRSEGAGGVVYFCLHALDRFADLSTTIIRGVFLIPLVEAQRLVGSGDADKNDFLLLAGYCGWAPGQLQGELDRGDTWTMAAADKRVLLGLLRDAQAALTVRLEGALANRRSGEGGEALTAPDVGDGLAEWRQLYTALGKEYSARLRDADDDEGHADEMLRRWIDACLIPPQYKASGGASVPGGGDEGLELSAGTVIRGSATAWLLGRPSERPSVEPRFSNGPPGQYLHKAVLLLVRDHATSDGEAALLVLLNGPQVGSVPADGTGVFFGGPNVLGSQGGVFEMKGSVPYRFQGLVLLLPGLLEELLQLGAFEVAEGVALEDVLKVAPEERWEAAGGRVETMREATVVRLGDVQRRKWYKRFLDIDV